MADDKKKKPEKKKDPTSDIDDDEGKKTKKETGAVPKQLKEEPQPSTSAYVSLSPSFEDELLPKPKGILISTVDNLKRLAVSPEEDDDTPADSFQRTLARHSQRVLGKLNIAAAAKKHLLRNLFTGEIEEHRGLQLSPAGSDTTDRTTSSDSDIKLPLDPQVFLEEPPSDPISEPQSDPIEFLRPDYVVTNKLPIFKYKVVLKSTEDEYKHFTIVKFNRAGPLYEPSLSYLAVICKNRIKIYDVPVKDSKFKIVLDHKEAMNVYVTCDWSYIKLAKGKPKTPRLAVGGKCAEGGGVVTILYMKGTNFYKEIPWLIFKENVSQVLFHKKDNNLLFISTNECISLWDIYQRKCIYVIDVPLVNYMDINAEGTYLVTAASNKVKVWNVDLTDAFIIELKKPTESEPSPMFDKNDYVALPGFICTQNKHSNIVDSVKWYHNTIISKDINGLILFWHLNAVGINTNKYTVVMKIKLNNCAYDTKLDTVIHEYMSTQRYLAVGSSNNVIHVWDFNAKIFLHIPKYEIKVPDCQHPINSITFSKCGNILVAATTDGTLYCWNHRHDYAYYSF